MLEFPELDQEKLKRASLFFLKLTVAGLFFRAILLLSPNTYALESILANVSGKLLQILGIPVETFGNRIKSGKTIFIVNQDCLGWKSVAAFLGLSWASEISLKNRLITLIVAGILFLNLIRIVVTITLSSSGILSFELLHMFLWRWGLTASIFVFWIFVYIRNKSG